MRYLIGIFGLALIGQTVSIEKERALGEGLAAEVRKQSTPVAGAEVDAYVQRVGARLAALAPETRYRFEVRVLEAPEMIGLPGGTVIIPASAFLTAKDEPAFAIALAHAMGHIALRHDRLRSDASGPAVYARPGGYPPTGFQRTASAQEADAASYGTSLAASGSSSTAPPIPVCAR